MPTIAEALRDEGEHIGIEMGIQLGIEIGKRESAEYFARKMESSGFWVDGVAIAADMSAAYRGPLALGFCSLITRSTNVARVFAR